jgi:hypothetical protein
MTDDVKTPQVDPAVPTLAVPLLTVPDATAVVVPPAADADPIPGAEPIPGATTGSVDTSVIQTVAQTVVPVVVEPVTEVIEHIAAILPEVVVPATTTVNTTVPVVAAAPVVVAPVTPVVVAAAPYIPPVATDLSATAPTVTAADPLTPKPSDDVLNPSTVTPQTDAPSFELGLDVIGTTKMTNAKGTAATAIIVERINRHMNFLIGKSAFATPAARELEQTTFIETIGNTLRLPYDQYALVTNQLLTAIKNNLDVFEKGWRIALWPAWTRRSLNRSSTSTAHTSAS